MRSSHTLRGGRLPAALALIGLALLGLLFVPECDDCYFVYWSFDSLRDWLLTRPSTAGVEIVGVPENGRYLGNLLGVLQGKLYFVPVVGPILRGLLMGGALWALVCLLARRARRGPVGRGEAFSMALALVLLAPRGIWQEALSWGAGLVNYLLPMVILLVLLELFARRRPPSALLAGARDERFAVCVPIQCGGGGATLAKRDFGENVATEMHMFPHWYCRAYRNYERNPAESLPFDQHLLLAALAPRKLLIGGFNDPWFDTEGEYLACRAAGPVWEFLGKPGLPGNAFPGNYDRSAIGPYLGYYRRTEQHGMADYDWRRLLKFAGEEEL